MEFLADPQVWISLLTLTALEIVLGIDNIIFISILAGKLPQFFESRPLGSSEEPETELRIPSPKSFARVASLEAALHRCLASNQNHTPEDSDSLLICSLRAD